ncbi:MAG: M23 family metallopeptidase [Chloroflexi bacterium]|nr:M23 family metallopeptidase [Chloroflexota bacterium]
MCPHSLWSRRQALRLFSAALGGSAGSAVLSGAALAAAPANPVIATIQRTRYDPILHHTINDVLVTFGSHRYAVPFLAFFEQTGGIARWGYPTSELLMEQPAALSQYYQRGIVDFHYRPDLGTYVLERRLVWDDIGGAQAGPGKDQGIEPPPVHPLGVVVGPWGHSVSNYLPDGTYTGFYSFFQRVGGVRSLGYPKTEARRDENALVQLHLPGATPGFIRQYFQAAVLEFHPDSPAPVEPALLGDMVRDLHYPNGSWQQLLAFQPQTPLSNGEWLALTGPAAPLETTFPPRLHLTARPATVVQGRSFVIGATGPLNLTLTSSLNGTAVPFAPTSGGYWAVAGFDPIAQIGEHELRLQAKNSQGVLIQQATLPVTVLAGVFPTLRAAVSLPVSKLPLLNRTLERAEDAFLTPIFSQFTPQQFWKGYFIYPVSSFVITTGFGEREIFTGRSGVSWHGGLDLAVPEGAPIHAANDGVVALARHLEVRGNTIILNHGVGVFTAYLHQSRFAVTEGQSVRKGDLIGYVGATGLATGPHVHWELRVHNVHVDPAQWTQEIFAL